MKTFDWHQRVPIIVAIKTGLANTESLIAKYLRQNPYDTQMHLAHLAQFQNAARMLDLQCYLAKLELSSIEGKAEEHLRLCVRIVYYDYPARGLVKNREIRSY